MKVLYDDRLKIAGIGIYPWARLGPQMWFRDYKIASLFDWDITTIDGLEVYSLHDYAGEQSHQGKNNTPTLLENPLFLQMLENFFSGYAMLTYKPVRTPKELSAHAITFLSDETKTGLSRLFENKVWFRQRFANKHINIPEYSVYSRKDLSADSRTLRRLLGKRKTVIIQDATLSGGKGTFIVSDIATLRRALETLENNQSASEKVVVSTYISGAMERSVQGVVTRYGVFVGPMQQQIIANSLLANLDIPGAELFCGTQISMSDSALWAYNQQKQNAMVVGEELRKEGYRGIFGVDSLVADGAVYTIEVNPRITGATPLLTMNYDAQKHIPFYLLHILELVGAEYQISDMSYDNTYGDCALIVPHSLRHENVTLSDGIRSGTYSSHLEYKSDQVVFDKGELAFPQVLLQSYALPNKQVKPGGRILSGFINYSIVDSNGALDSGAERMVQTLLKKVGVNKEVSRR